MDKIIEEGVSKLRRDLLTYPIENSRNKCKRLLKNMLGRGETAPDRFFWPHAMMADALWQYYKASGDESIVKLLETYYDSHQVTAKDIKYPDTVMKRQENSSTRRCSILWQNTLKVRQGQKMEAYYIEKIRRKWFMLIR